MLSFSSIELFAGAGGLALGLERAGFEAVLLNEMDKYACATLRDNRPHWQVVEGSIEAVDFKPYHRQCDFVSGGFPCQAFSYAGYKRGFDDVRGTLFFQFARAIDEIRPKVFLAENVRGLLNHDNGKTLATIKTVIHELGYSLVSSSILKAMYFRVPQKRERLFLVAVRNDLRHKAQFHLPKPYHRAMNLSDGLKAGELYPCDVPVSIGAVYPEKKKAVLDLVPAGGYWRDLPEAIQREYMKKSYFLGGGKTGIARRLAWHEPSLTLTCSPSQNQTERCHPDETRPLTVREYARIQTFPDDWQFMGSMSAQYKQIGNAVPVNLAYAMGQSVWRYLYDLQQNTVASHKQLHHAVA
jgi:DNA (cytosine-5)-methyltransferase 1